LKRDGTLVAMNPRAREFLGGDEALGRRLWDGMGWGWDCAS